MGVFSPASPGISSVQTVSGRSAFDTSAGITVGTTETSLVIPSGTVAFLIRGASPKEATLTVAGAATGTGSKLTSWDIMPGNIWGSELNGTTALTVYIKSNKPNTDIQVQLWT